MPRSPGFVWLRAVPSFARTGRRIGSAAERYLRLHATLRRIGRVVGVNLRRLDVAVAHPFLDGPERCDGRGHSSAEGVAQAMESDRTKARRRERALEALPQLRGVRMAGSLSR